MIGLPLRYLSSADCFLSFESLGLEEEEDGACGEGVAEHEHEHEHEHEEEEDEEEEEDDDVDEDEDEEDDTDCGRAARICFAWPFFMPISSRS